MYSMNKTVLFVTYGGGHAAMVVPVIRELQQYPDICTEALVLTLGGPYFQRQGLPYRGFKDFIVPEDKEAIAWGEKLAVMHHQAETGIEEKESIAYLGLSYWDLVMREGVAEAARLWGEKKRNAFFPLSVLERVIDKIKPDMVVTTNSPRAEYAAQVIANKRRIPTMSMFDLFGLNADYQIQADYLTVISPLVIENLRKDTGLRDGQKFLITGNPAFDQVLDYRGPINHDWRKQHFPTLPEGARILLWLDSGAYFHTPTGLPQPFSPEECEQYLDALRMPLSIIISICSFAHIPRNGALRSLNGCTKQGIRMCYLLGMYRFTLCSTLPIWLPPMDLQPVSRLC